MADSEGWYYLDGQRQSQGPFPLSYLQTLNQHGGYFKSDAVMFWREGQGEWKPLRELPELHARLQEAPPADGDDATAAGADQQQGRARRGAGAAAAPAVPADPQLAGFLSEISSLEAEGDVLAAQGAGDAPASPPPDERRFEDDDGTWYVWDSALRKFVPEQAAITGSDPGAAVAVGGPSAGAQPYREEDMVFEADQEAQPAYEPPPKYSDLPDIDDEDDSRAKPRQSGDPQQPAAGGDGGVQAAGVSAAVDEAVDTAKRNAQSAALEAAKEKSKKAKAHKQQQQQEWFELKNNTSVYVTGLPEDVTEAEVAEVFTKCGIIKEDVQGRPRIKVYRDKETGRPKGDGLVTYLKEPSVHLAIQILDGTPLRYGLPNMTVTQAKFEQKGEAFVARTANKKEAKKKLVKLERRALGWGGFDDALKPQLVTVVLKHMFHPDELIEQPLLREELEADVRAECSKLGRVDRLRVFGGHPEGVVSVKFTTPEAADECVRLMNGRFFGGRQLEAAKWDGYTNYNLKVRETEEEQQARLERFARELEQGGAAGAEPADQ